MTRSQALTEVSIIKYYRTLSTTPLLDAMLDAYGYAGATYMMAMERMDRARDGARDGLDGPDVDRGTPPDS